MDFGREGYCEEDEQMIHKSGNKQFPFSPSSASASSSSPQYKGFFPLSNGRTTTTEAPIYSHQQHHHHGQQQQQQRGSSSWYETQEESSRSSYDGGSTTPKFELMMEVSPPANHHQHHHHHHQEDAGESQLALGNSATNNNIQKEHMFDKVVTPSDVGKLNRLVIPKQHAEKYFPLDSSTNEKGLLLNFEDRTGKPWRFRYSYWNSSQSYVMTKGWSRFVKEKKLDAGDIVSFQRGVGELGKDRLYIDWRRRPNAPDHTTSFPTGLSFPHNFAFHRSIPWSPLFLRPPPANMSSAAMHYPQQQQQPNSINFHHHQTQSRNNNNYHYNNAMNPCQGSIIYLRSAAAGGGAATGTPQDHHEVRMVQVQDGGGGGGGVDPMVFDSVPVVHGKAAAKKLRLFGVNMECGVSSSESILDESNAAAAAAMAASQSSSHNIPFTLQSRLYNGIPLQTDFLNKGKSSSSMSLDLDI